MKFRTTQVLLSIAILSCIACGSGGGSGGAAGSGAAGPAAVGSKTFSVSLSSLDIVSARASLSLEIDRPRVTSGNMTLEPVD